ncbi:MAG: VWA domain-containing protein [Candidatus Gracilibacteria bacterium]|nr:VWA domain-containing protein [Candidatus Gracilibacteria bacterium]
MNDKSYNFIVSRKKMAIRGIFFFFSLISFIAAYLNMDILDFNDSMIMKSSNIIFSIDISKSMDIEDMRYEGKEYSRIEYSKEIIRGYVNENPQNNYGLMVFAGDTLIISPLTRDIDTYLTFLDGIDSNYISKGGTNFSKMLDVIGNMADKKEKNIILLSDGGDKEDSVISNFDPKKSLIKIFAVGIGTQDGGKIPMGKDLFGKKVYKVLNGEYIISALNEDNLKKITDNGKGVYINGKDNADKMKEITDNLIISGNSQTKNTAENDRRILVIISFIMAMIGYLIPYRFKRGE